MNFSLNSLLKISSNISLNLPSYFLRIVLIRKKDVNFTHKDKIKGTQCSPVPDEQEKQDETKSSQKEENIKKYGTKLAHMLEYLGEIFKGDDNRVIIFIEDDGPGIPEDQYKNVFKPFFRLDKSRSLNNSGVGLGLAIVEDVINSHGGNIQMGKSKMNGLSVKISLPY